MHLPSSRRSGGAEVAPRPDWPPGGLSQSHSLFCCWLVCFLLGLFWVNRPSLRWFLVGLRLQGDFSSHTRVFLVTLLFVGVVLGEQTEFYVAPRPDRPPGELLQSHSFVFLVGLLFVVVVLGEQTEFEVGPRWAPPPGGLLQSHSGFSGYFAFCWGCFG